ncbi:NAD(P)/FAD-dependent oxidoreductase [Massilia sp. YIM B02763]|uniref:NAD(P)/FAD-dependent oxidoreductase n=1 Tax=Massilia sp. YIM B02763 TaxID=3050130 RepID=UPI0025B6B95B|nr:NAD(P)/FAD-dependent oxidoreductase [Massilia sp. YIM B02763]MDN4051841.1 NAD(P)/FAD-dependent oxidoreductase [Massilia sp. YIM B02763]
MSTHPHAPQSHVHDTLVVGGGPGGLTAAIYLRRFTRDVALVDKGNSRLRLIPVSHNYPGFPEGVPGTTLLGNLTAQLERYGGTVTHGEILGLRIEDGVFVADCLPEGAPDDARREIRAHTVLLATGVADAGLPIEMWREAIAFGSVRLCPVCDGFDVMDKHIAVATSEVNPVGHALFMRTFSAEVTLFERMSPTALTDDDRRRLAAAGVRLVDSPLLSVTLDASMKPVLHTEDGQEHGADVFYPMLGENARSGLAAKLGAETAQCEEIVVDVHGATSVPGLYAIGDVTVGLNQIAVATGQAARAATHIHNRLPPALRTASTRPPSPGTTM